MPHIPSMAALHALRTLTRAQKSCTSPFSQLPTKLRLHQVQAQLHHSHTTTISHSRTFTSTAAAQTTLNQVRNRCRRPKKARRPESPAMVGRPAMKGVCLKVGITKPKKPNSGQRKTAKVRLSSGKVISAYIPGEGHNVQQHSVVMVRGGRSQDCPGVGYHLVRGALDLGGVPNRVTSRSKYGTKKPKAAVV